MSTYKPNTKILPFILLAVFGVLLIYDMGVEQEEAPSEIITETLSLPTQSIPSIQTKKIHTVKDGENLSLIFEKYKVPLNETYKIFRKDSANEVKNSKKRLLHPLQAIQTRQDDVKCMQKTRL